MTNKLITNPNNLFNDTNKYEYSRKQFFDMVYLRTPLLDTLNEVVKYYRENVIYLDSTNILDSILFNIPLGLDIKDNNYLEVINSRIYSLTLSLGITSSFNFGKIFKNEFYSNTEILILDDSEFDLKGAISNWKDIVAVKALRHPWSNINFTLPVGGVLDSSNDNVSVISINIALLAIQFRSFIKERLLENNPINTLIPIFIAQYVLPNMLAHQTDIAIFNIISNKYFGIKNSRPLVNNPFPLPVHNYMQKVEYFSEKVIKYLGNNALFYNQALEAIPAVFNKDMNEVMKMPSIANTRQVWWALVLARLNVMMFLVNVGGIEGIKFNKYFISEYQKDLSYLKSQRIYSRYFTRSVSDNIDSEINSILEI